jgi:hypothetical protein
MPFPFSSDSTHPDVSRRLKMGAGIGDVPPRPRQDPAYESTAGGSLVVADPFTEAYRGIDLPPAYYGRNINVGQLVTLPVGASRQEIVAYRIPNGTIASIRFIANGLENISDSEFVRWSLVVDGADVVGYSNFIGLIAPAISAPAPVVFMLNAGQRMSWVASNLAGIIITGVAAMFRGWMWAPTLRPVGPRG